MKRLLYFLLLSLFMVGCEIIGHPHDVYIKNNSSKKIYFYISNKYPDTSLPLKSTYVKSISPNDGYSFDNPYRKPYPNMYSNDNILIFFIDADVFEHHDWDVIRRDDKILERRMFSKQDLINNNWIIVYP